jgi:hypothetical protein
MAIQVRLLLSMSPPATASVLVPLMLFLGGLDDEPWVYGSTRDSSRATCADLTPVPRQGTVSIDARPRPA